MGNNSDQINQAAGDLFFGVRGLKVGEDDDDGDEGRDEEAVEKRTNFYETESFIVGQRGCVSLYDDGIAFPFAYASFSLPASAALHQRAARSGGIAGQRVETLLIHEKPEKGVGIVQKGRQ